MSSLSSLPQTKKTIRPPTTTLDDGQPTKSCKHDIDRVLRLIEDERHFTAQELLHDIQDRLGIVRDNTTDGETTIEKNPSSPQSQTPNEDGSDSNNATGRQRGKLRLRPFQFNRQQQTKNQTETYKDHEETKAILEANQEILDTLEDRCLLFKKAKQNLDVDDDWTLAQTLFGVTTYYRREDDGSLSIKLEGPIDGVPIFDQVSVLREIDLHYKWAPFCSSSLTIEHLDKLDTVGWFVVGLPHFGLMRDGCFRAIGCDSIYEDGSVMLVAQGINDKPEDGVDKKSLEQAIGSSEKSSSVATADTGCKKNSDGNEVPLDTEEKRIMELLSNDPILDSLEIPSPPTRMGSGRMTIKTFQAMVHIDSPTSATSKIVANVDPNLPLIPQSLLDFIMKRLCGVLLSKLQSAAKKISKDPVTNPHAIKMREEEDFYKGWLMEKFKGISKLRGWEDPEFAVFELSDAQLDIAEAYSEKKKWKTQKSIKFYHSQTDENLDEFLESNPRNGVDAASEPAYVGEASSNSGSGLVRTASVDDSVSELSKNSSLSTYLRHGNPIATYLRDVEERTQLRKAKEIKQSRQRAADRLKPKELDEESRSRLDELRLARERRNATTKPKSDQADTSREVALDASSSPLPRQTYMKTAASKSWAVFFSNNERSTRIVVISILMSTLFYLLFMCKLFEEFAFAQEGSFYLQRERDVATVLYMILAGTVHFCLLYVALMYSFSSLEIGKITGKQAKKFYGDHVHLAVCITSGGLVTLAIVKAVLSKSFEWAVWNAVLLFRIGKTSSVLQNIITAFSQFEPPELASNTIRSSVDIISPCMASMNKLLVESNIIGRTIVSPVGLLWSVWSKVVTDWNSFIANVVDNYEGGGPAESWREIAFMTSRNSLAYTATFVLVLLFLFNASARQARLSENVELELKDDDSIDRSETKAESVSNESLGEQSGRGLVATSSEGSDRDKSRSRFKFNRSMSPDFDTIDEEGNDNDDTKKHQ
mmetsp:Transcript_34275/g.82553  ORF Transcript_34275/g.82553 Transcript_34275/m.82553 type:complete len:990 (-) Transcript_34275:158-3127(-)